MKGAVRSVALGALGGAEASQIISNSKENVMNFDHFVGQVQHRAQLPDTGSALWAIQAAFQSLAERLDAGEAKDLAAQLPRPFQIYFNVEEHAEPFSAHEFFKRVSEREEVDA